MSDIDKAVELFTVIINQSHKSNGESPVGKEPKDLSKIIYEELVDSEYGNLKLFFKSTSRTTNNIPYTFDRKINIDQFIEILKYKRLLLKSKSVSGGISSIIGDLSKEQDSIEPDTKDAIESIPDNSIAKPISSSWDSQMQITAE